MPYQPSKENYLVNACMKQLENYRVTGAREVGVFHVSEYVPGSIYVEMNHRLEVRELVGSMSDVFWSRDFEFVPVEDVISLRRIRSVRLAVGTWARVTQKGLYHDDLCNIVGFEEDDQSASVLLIPRVNLLNGQPEPKASKRKGKAIQRLRPVARLFHPDPSTRGFEGIDGAYLKFNGKKYKDGLLVHTIRFKNLRHAFPTIAELEIFGQSSALDSSLIHKTWTLCDAASLTQGDRVRIVGGEQGGSIGHIQKTGDGFLSVISGKPGVPAVEVPLANVRSHFVIGDYVLVKAGKYTGKSGGVIKVEQKSTTDIVTFVDEASIQTPNILEVRIFSSLFSDLNIIVDYAVVILPQDI